MSRDFTKHPKDFLNDLNPKFKPEWREVSREPFYIYRGCDVRQKIIEERLEHSVDLWRLEDATEEGIDISHVDDAALIQDFEQFFMRFSLHDMLVIQKWLNATIQEEMETRRKLGYDDSDPY